MREAGLTPAPVILDSRQQRFTARLANACSNKLKELHQNPTSGAPICRVVKKENEPGQTTEGMKWPAPGDESEVRTIILDDDTAGKRAAQCWARENAAKVGVAVWMWWTDGSRSDNGRVGAAAVCKHGNQWRSRRSFLRTGCIEVFNAELWTIGLTLDVKIETRETLQRHGVKTVAIFSDLQTAIRRAAHLEPGPRQRLARGINRRAQAHLAHSIATDIHWVPRPSGIPGNEEGDHQPNLAQDARGNTVIERP